MLDWKDISSEEERVADAISIAIGQHSYLLKFLFDQRSPRLKNEVKILLHSAAGYCRGEQILIRVALDLSHWNSSKTKPATTYGWTSLFHRFRRKCSIQPGLGS
jgi:hypothetical protein